MHGFKKFPYSSAYNSRKVKKLGHFPHLLGEGSSIPNYWNHGGICHRSYISYASSHFIPMGMRRKSHNKGVKLTFLSKANSKLLYYTLIIKLYFFICLLCMELWAIYRCHLVARDTIWGIDWSQSSWDGLLAEVFRGFPKLWGICQVICAQPPVSSHYHLERRILRKIHGPIQESERMMAMIQ